MRFMGLTPLRRALVFVVCLSLFSGCLEGITHDTPESSGGFAAPPVPGESRVENVTWALADLAAQGSGIAIQVSAGSSTNFSIRFHEIYNTRFPLRSCIFMGWRDQSVAFLGRPPSLRAFAGLGSVNYSVDQSLDMGVNYTLHDYFVATFETFRVFITHSDADGWLRNGAQFEFTISANQSFDVKPIPVSQPLCVEDASGLDQGLRAWALGDSATVNASSVFRISHEGRGWIVVGSNVHDVELHGPEGTVWKTDLTIGNTSVAQLDVLEAGNYQFVVREALDASDSQLAAVIIDFL